MVKKIFISILLVFLALDLQNYAGAQRKRLTKKRLKFCRLDNVFECHFEQLSFLTHQRLGTGIADNDEEFEQFCFGIHDYFDYCARQWLKRCSTDVYNTLFFKLLLKPVHEAMGKYCEHDGSIRREFLRHVKCTNHQVKTSPPYQADCLRKLQGNAEYSHERAKQLGGISGAVDFLRSFCCVYNQWEGCIVRHLTETCGAPAGASFPSIIDAGGHVVLGGFCDRFDPRNQTACPSELFEAPKSYVPLGLKSNSAISYVFSYNCPNVGWGVEKSRDF